MTLRVREMNRAKERRIYRAASLIQANYRGYYERVYVRGLRREKLLREKKEFEIATRNRKAAECIQRAIRCFFAIKKVNTLRTMKRIEMDEQRTEAESRSDPKDIVKRLFWQHEALLKTNITKEKELRHKSRNDAAEKIQSVVKMYFTRREYIADKLHRERLALARKMQFEKDAADAKAAKELYVQQTVAAIQMQKIIRGFITRVRFAKGMGECGKGLSSEVAEADRQDAGAIKIQSRWRIYAARKYANRLYRRKAMDKEKHILYEAARCIQKTYRGVLGRRIAKRMKREKIYREVWDKPAGASNEGDEVTLKSRRPYPQVGIAVFNENIKTQSEKAALCIQRVYKGFSERRAINRIMREKEYRDLWSKPGNTKSLEPQQSGNGFAFSSNINIRRVVSIGTVAQPPRPPSAPKKATTMAYERRYTYKSQNH